MKMKLILSIIFVSVLRDPATGWHYLKFCGSRRLVRLDGEAILDHM